jgi:hypothetical protein
MKTKPTRIIFKYKDRFYKFMNYFPDKKDNSFYFHIYDNKSENLRVPNIPLAKRGDNKIDFNDFVETEFKRNKLSFHQSGFIHSTDNNGNRLQDGIIGIPFEKIAKSLLILVLGPKKIDSLTEIQQIRENTDIIISLPDNISPFTLNFDVFRNDKINELDINNPNPILGGFIMTEYNGKEFGLRLYLQKVLGNANWPPFNLTLKRIG